MTLGGLLGALVAESEMRFLVVGGHAVIAHGYPRTTFDLDLLVEKETRAAWRKTVERLGYQLLAEAESFSQFKPPSGALDLDLMLVGAETFGGIWGEGLTVSLDSVSVRIPSLDHLLALKLHVLKQNLQHRAVKDLDDIIRLVLANHLDLESSHYRHLFEKYGTLDHYETVIRAVQ